VLRQQGIKALPYIISAVMVGTVTVLCLLLNGHIDPANFAVIYILAVVLSAVWWGMWPSIFTSILGVLAFDFFFVHPLLTFAVSDLSYIYIFAGYLVVGIVVSLVASRAREQARQAQGREQRTLVLYRLSRELAASDSIEEVAAAIKKNTGELLECSTAIYTGRSNELFLTAADADFPVDEHERAVATWVLVNGSAAGALTRTLAASKGLYVPLKTVQGTIGVLGLYKWDNGVYDMEMIEALSSQSSVALQRAILAEEARLADRAKENNRLQAVLLNSISHDLRTPLVSITGALSTLKQDFDSMDPEVRSEMLETAHEESLHLNRLVGNLLDITRVESGTLKINIKPCDLRDVIGSSLRVLKDRMENRKAVVDISEGIFEVPMDFVLMMRVFMNLIDNAVKYSATESVIKISAAISGENVLIKVVDNGFGIPAKDLERIFDKFYRAEKPRQVAGSGLGLSICRGIVEAHHGRIWAQNNPAGGASICMELPAYIKEEKHGK
jgi:two-component system sensor histidine kinase KdpD